METKHAYSIKELKNMVQAEEVLAVGPPIERLLMRRVSIYITKALIGTPITPNMVTFCQFLVIIGATAAFSMGTRSSALTGAFLVLFSHILDCVDGELARAKKLTSKMGTQLELICHWVASGLLILGITSGVYEHTHKTIILYLGMLTLIGDYTFHFLYIHLSYTINKDTDYGHLHTVTRWLFRFMPINTNLAIIGGITNNIMIALTAWCAILNISWMLVFFLYYRGETAFVEKK